MKTSGVTTDSQLQEDILLTHQGEVDVWNKVTLKEYFGSNRSKKRNDFIV